MPAPVGIWLPVAQRASLYPLTSHAAISIVVSFHGIRQYRHAVALRQIDHAVSLSTKADKVEGSVALECCRSVCITIITVISEYTANELFKQMARHQCRDQAFHIFFR